MCDRSIRFPWRIAGASAGVVLIILTLRVQAQPADERPILKEPQEKLVEIIDRMAAENVAAASVNVAHDAARKRIRILAAVPEATRGLLKVQGYEVEIVYSANIASAKSGVGSYRFQHNNQVLTFAAARYASGEKSLGKRLIGLLAEAEPGLFWEDSNHDVLAIKQILAGLDKDDDTVRAFLLDRSRAWATILKTYGSESDSN